MTITATAPVPAHCRLATTDTAVIPRLSALSVTEAAGWLDIPAWVAFTRGARLRSEADVTAVASTMPPLSPEQIDALDRWCARVAVTPVATVADWYGCSLATAEHVRDLLGGAR